jgi:hypothetical protein
VDWRLIKYGGAVHSFTQPMAGNDNSRRGLQRTRGQALVGRMKISSRNF